MANPLRGELDFVHEDQTYTLVLDVNAVCHAEQLLEMKAHELIAAIQGPLHMAALRGVLWAALKRRHNLSVDEAGTLLRSIGIEPAAALMVRALAAAFPPPAKKKPARARRSPGTGSSSSAAG